MRVLGYVPRFPGVFVRADVQFVVSHHLDHADSAALIIGRNHPDDGKEFFLDGVPHSFSG